MVFLRLSVSVSQTVDVCVCVSVHVHSLMGPEEKQVHLFPGVQVRTGGQMCPQGGFRSQNVSLGTQL